MIDAFTDCFTCPHYSDLISCKFRVCWQKNIVLDRYVVSRWHWIQARYSKSWTPKKRCITHSYYCSEFVGGICFWIEKRVSSEYLKNIDVFSLWRNEKNIIIFNLNFEDDVNQRIWVIKQTFIKIDKKEREKLQTLVYFDLF